jgi:hypothetical protein
MKLPIYYDNYTNYIPFDEYSTRLFIALEPHNDSFFVRLQRRVERWAY